MGQQVLDSQFVSASMVGNVGRVTGSTISISGDQANIQFIDPGY